MADLTAQIESNLVASTAAERRVSRFQPDMLNLEERLRKAEHELAAGDVMRDGLRADKEKVCFLFRNLLRN